MFDTDSDDEQEEEHIPQEYRSSLRATSTKRIPDNSTLNASSLLISSPKRHRRIGIHGTPLGMVSHRRSKSPIAMDDAMEIDSSNEGLDDDDGARLSNFSGGKRSNSGGGEGCGEEWNDNIFGDYEEESRAYNEYSGGGAGSDDAAGLNDDEGSEHSNNSEHLTNVDNDHSHNHNGDDCTEAELDRLYQEKSICKEKLREIRTQLENEEVPAELKLGLSYGMEAISKELNDVTRKIEELQQTTAGTGTGERNSAEARRLFREKEQNQKVGLSKGENSITYRFTQKEIDQFGGGKWKATRKNVDVEDREDILSWRLCILHGGMINGIQKSTGIDKIFFARVIDIVHDVAYPPLIPLLLNAAFIEARLPRCSHCGWELLIKNYDDYLYDTHHELRSADNVSYILESSTCSHCDQETDGQKCTSKVIQWFSTWYHPNRDWVFSRAGSNANNHARAGTPPHAVTIERHMQKVKLNTGNRTKMVAVATYLKGGFPKMVQNNSRSDHNLLYGDELSNTVYCARTKANAQLFAFGGDMNALPCEQFAPLGVDKKVKDEDNPSKSTMVTFESMTQLLGDGSGCVVVPLQGGSAEKPQGRSKNLQKKNHPKGAILTWAVNNKESHRNVGRDPSVTRRVIRFLNRNTPALLPAYVDLITNPDTVVARLTSPFESNHPQWFKSLRGAVSDKPPPTVVDCLLWLLSQFCLLVPIEDPNVIAHRWGLHKKKGLNLMPLDEVIEMSVNRVGMMQCNCPNGSHYCDDAHSLGDMLHKGIIQDFKSVAGQNPAKWGQIHQRNKKKSKKTQFKTASLVAPKFNERH